MCVLEIIFGCPGDIKSVSWRYLIGVLVSFDGYHGDIFMDVPEIFQRYPGDVLMGVPETFDRCPGDI